MSKWKQFHETHASETKNSFAEYFKNNLVTHLTAPHDPNGEKNQPKHVINDAMSTSAGTLSRIFDAFKYPVVSYDELKDINSKPDGLRKFMSDNLNEVLPELLNDNRSGLNPKLIEAIGQENYDGLLQNTTEKEIAQQFINAVFVSYGQRVVDNISDNSLKGECFLTINPKLETLSKDATLDGLSPESDPSNNLSLKELKGMLTNFSKLLDEVKASEMTIPKIESSLNALTTGLDWINMTGMPEDIRKDKAITNYDKAVLNFTENVKGALENISKPEEAGLLVKLIRVIFNNEKLLQSLDEKRYAKQMDLLPKLNSLMEKANNVVAQKSNSPSESDNSTKQQVTLK